MPKTLSTPKVRFVLHIRKGRENTPCPVSAVMEKNRTRYKVATGEAAKPSEMQDNRRVMPKRADALTRIEVENFNKRLDWWENFLREIWEEYHTPQLGRAYPEPLTNAKFNDLVRIKQGLSTQKQTPDLLTFAAEYVAAREKEKGANHSTVNTLRYGLKNLTAYCHSYGRLNYEHINFEWLERFKIWLFKPVKTTTLERKALNQNSAALVVTAIKQLVSEARKKGYTDNTMVNERNFSIKKAPTNKAAFYLDEIGQIHRTDLSKHPRKREMEKTRILLFVGAFSGMRFSDYGKLKKELVHIENGELLLNVFAQKTKREIGIPFIPLFQTVLEQCKWAIPKMAVQRFNENLKELCKYVGLERKVLVMESVGGKQTSKEMYFYEVVSSHCCRRFFISTMLLLGVPASQLMPITGHGTEKQLRAYAAIENRQNAANISKQFRRGMMDFLGITND